VVGDAVVRQHYEFVPHLALEACAGIAGERIRIRSIEFLLRVGKACIGRFYSLHSDPRWGGRLHPPGGALPDPASRSRRIAVPPVPPPLPDCAVTGDNGIVAEQVPDPMRRPGFAPDTLPMADEEIIA
jgi:hypothetical protein